MVVEVKTQGAGGVQAAGSTLGAERSHPASVAQAAFYTLRRSSEDGLRDAVIATMDTGATERGTGSEIIPADRLETGLG